jgi:Guanosine polyphosphate pyrophosphohydrolases/synthetases
MVAVREAHLHENEAFELSTWVKRLGQDASTTQALVDAYQYCRTLSEEESDLSQPLWRGREMIEILVTLSMDADTLLAALFFPVVEARLVSLETLADTYSTSIVSLIEGVQQTAAIRHLNTQTETEATSSQVDNVRRMLLSMVEDFRCVVIKLAERICYLREVKDASESVRQQAAKESANIYAPLANRLGIGQLKWELEDYAFRYQHAQTYKQIAKQLAERRIDREHYITDFVDDLQQAMEASNINAQVYGRPKHIYSIWRKMQKKNLQFDELFDVRAVRIIAEELQDCYAAVGGGAHQIPPSTQRV